MLGVPKNTALTGSTGDVSSISGGKKPSVAGYTSFNRFSTFVKSGGESFVLGKLNATVQEADFIQVVVILLMNYDLRYFCNLRNVSYRTEEMENTAG